MPVNSNHINMQEFKGIISACRFCRNADPAATIDQKGYCKFCCGSGYVHHCVQCDGKGLVGGGNVWGNASKGDYHSTCNICGGTGMIPSRKELFEAQQATAKEITKVTLAAPGIGKLVENAVVQSAAKDAPSSGMKEGQSAPR